MNRLASASAAALLTAVLTHPATATAASNTAVTSIPVDPATQIEMHATANCVLAENKCYFNTTADLLTPEGPTGFPGDTWARQTITLRSNSRDAWQEASYSAPSGNPREVKGSNHENVLSKMYKATNNVEISITYFGGGPIERFQADGESTPISWNDGRTDTKSVFYACSQIQVVYSGVNLTTPTACAQTTFS
ncbi:hypothetical protein A5662_10200 [Mycobacteriaceae bacterium 1482268.1]|nr:hypothetical protein A5662_10200 [Mycobacteriaceae bacterium 1482268.1]